MENNVQWSAWESPEVAWSDPAMCGGFTDSLSFLLQFLNRDTAAHVPGWHMHSECDGDGNS